MKFLDALVTEDTRTENGMVTHSTSSSSLVDLFFKMGGVRKDPTSILPFFSKALQVNPTLTMKMVFYGRDVRGGQGERKLFRMLYQSLMAHGNVELGVRNFVHIPEYGRWDDAILIASENKILWDVLLVMLSKYRGETLPSDSSLLAKWLPREGKRNGAVAKRIMSDLGLSPKAYRQWIAQLASVPTVENLACANRWEDVNYNHVPSIASKKYRKAFKKHDDERYSAYVSALSKPESGAKVNAGAIFPHDVVKPMLGYSAPSRTEIDLLQAQWKALPNYLPEGSSYIPVCDVSGSMDGDPMLVSISLGLYLSERNVGAFKDAFITFSGNPQLQKLSGELYARVQQLHRAEWQMNTNLRAVFELILNQAVKNSVAPEDMPKGVLIISDMQFDQCMHNSDDTAIRMIRRMYSEAGYEMPAIVFWNVRTSSGVPVKHNKNGVALVSGFSPSIVKSVLETSPEEFSPAGIVMTTLMSPRYERIR